MIRRWPAAHLLHVATADCCRERLACEWWRWETRFATTLRSHHNRLLGEVTRVTKLFLYRLAKYAGASASVFGKGGRRDVN